MRPRYRGAECSVRQSPRKREQEARRENKQAWLRSPGLFLPVYGRKAFGSLKQSWHVRLSWASCTKHGCRWLAGPGSPAGKGPESTGLWFLLDRSPLIRPSAVDKEQDRPWGCLGNWKCLHVFMGRAEHKLFALPFPTCACSWSCLG